MTLILLAQLIVPVALLAMLARERGGRRWLLIGLVVAIGYFAAVSRIGLWTHLPGSLPLAFGAIALALAALGWTRRAPPRRGRRGRFDRLLGASVYLAAGAIALWGGYEAVVTQRLPSGAPVRLAFPLEPGRYLIVNGGARSSTNSHVRLADATVPRYRAFRGAAQGLDIVATDRFGRRADGWLPDDPARYAIWNRRVLSPCDGTVLGMHAEAPDMAPPRVDRRLMAGNHVRLRCGDAHVLLAHFRRGSVAVRPGQRVRVGQLLGRVGNSGNSGEPHLHVHAQWPGTDASPFDADARPILFDGGYRVRGDRVDAVR